MSQHSKDQKTMSSSSSSFLSTNEEGEYVTAINRRLINPKTLQLNSEKEDFDYWLIQILNIARQVGISEDVIKENTATSLLEKKTDLLTLSSDQKTILAQSQAVYSAMFSLIEPKLYSIVQHVHIKGSSESLYKALQGRYNPTSLTSSFKAQRELSSLSLNNEESVTSLLNHVIKLRNMIEQFTSNADDPYKMAVFNALPRHCKRTTTQVEIKSDFFLLVLFSLYTVKNIREKKTKARNKEIKR